MVAFWSVKLRANFEVAAVEMTKRPTPSDIRERVRISVNKTSKKVWKRKEEIYLYP